VPEHILRSTWAWPKEDRDGGVGALRVRAWLEQGDELRLTKWGSGQRRALEEGADTLAVVPSAVLGEERCAELRARPGPGARRSPGSCPDAHAMFGSLTESREAMDFSVAVFDVRRHPRELQPFVSRFHA
jgi:hypothetical protein